MTVHSMTGSTTIGMARGRGRGGGRGREEVGEGVGWSGGGGWGFLSVRHVIAKWDSWLAI